MIHVPTILFQIIYRHAIISQVHGEYSPMT